MIAAFLFRGCFFKESRKKFSKNETGGLATVILRKLIDYMNSGVPKPLDNQILLSTLHTGPAAPLYRKLGWESILFEQVKYFPVAVQNSSLNFRKTEFSDNDVAVRRIFIARDLFD